MTSRCEQVRSRDQAGTGLLEKRRDMARWHDFWARIGSYGSSMATAPWAVDARCGRTEPRWGKFWSILGPVMDSGMASAPLKFRIRSYPPPWIT